MKISSKIAIFYFLSTIALALLLSITFHFSHMREVEALLDGHLSEDAEQIHTMLGNKNDAIGSLKQIVYEKYWLKITKNNQTIYTSEIAKSIQIPASQILSNTTVTIKTDYTNFTGNDDVIFRVHVKKYDDGTTIAIATVIDDSVTENYRKLVLILLSTLVIISVLVYFLMKFLLRPITDISMVLRKLSEDNLSPGFTKKSNDEIGFLIESLNLTFERLKTHFTYQKNFLTIMSHELKTPLSVIKNHIEHAIEGQDTPLELKQKFSNDLEQISKLNGLIHRLLLLTRLEEKTIIPKIEQFDLSELANELVAFFADLAESQNRYFNADIISGVFVTGDRELMYRALFNILDNAIKYTPEEKSISFKLYFGDKNEAVISVKNEGDKIEPYVIKTAENSMFAKSQYDRDGIKNGVGLRLIIAILKLHSIEYKIESIDNSNNFRLFFHDSSIAKLKES